MNKEEFIAFIAKEKSITKKAADESISNVVDSVISAMEKGLSVNLIGFGSFYLIPMKARKGVNPKTKAPMMIDAYIKPNFKPGQWLKTAANKSENK